MATIGEAKGPDGKRWADMDDEDDAQMGEEQAGDRVELENNQEPPEPDN